MRARAKGYLFFVPLCLILIFQVGPAYGGILKSLEEELTSIVERTDSYLVTVKGLSGGRDLIATGIVYDADGHVITSYHACQAGDFEVTFKDGSTYPATKVGVDPESGLGVLKISGAAFDVPQWGKSSELKEGSWITVVGNSYGVPATVNFGLFEGRTDEGLLQLSVNVSPGSSGGAVLDIDGRVVGVLVAREAGPSVIEPRPAIINAAGGGFPYRMKLLEAFGGLSSQKSYAVGIEMVDGIVKQLIETGEVKRGFLGISQRNLTASQREKLGVSNGVMVAEVVEDSPAEVAGLKKGDVIVAVDSQAVTTTGCLYGLIRSHRPGDKILIEYVRDGESKQTEAVLDESQSDVFMGGLELRRIVPRVEFDKKHGLARIGDLELELSKLRKAADRLSEELKKLKDSLRD